MPIRLKQTTNTSDQFYPLNERALSDGNKVGLKDPNSKETRKKLTTFSKNVLKSTKNLAFDVTDQYVPNLKEVKNSFKETIAAAREDTKKEFGPLLDTAKKMFSGNKDPGALKEKISKEKKEILDRLKSGKFYTSMEDEIEASFGGDLDFGDDFDFSGNSDSYALVSENDSLSEEPFGGVRKGRVKSVNVSARNRQLKNKTTTMRPSKKKSSGGSSQLRLGDELVSSTTSSVGSSIIRTQNEIWARSYTADKQNFEKLYGYQNQILKGVNNIVEFNNNVMSQNVTAQMEFQGKLLAAQQDSLASLKELKDAMLVVSSYKQDPEKEHLGSKMASNAVGLDGAAYWKNIKKNITDYAASNPLLSALMMTPMMGDMLSMSQDTGMKMVNPLNMASKGLVSMFLSKNTKNRMMDFNELLSNFGGIFTGRMNMLGRYGKGPMSTIGRLLGTRNNTVSVIDMGLKDPNAVVGWTSKSDRTLNTVIPTLLAKQLAVMSGKDELHYDYKTGKFKTVKSTQEEIKLRREMAYQNADTVSFNTAIATTGKSALSSQEQNSVRGKEQEYIKTITKNLIKTHQMFDPGLAESDNSIGDQFRESITNGIPDEHKAIAIKMYTYSYQHMTNAERIRLNGSIRNVSQNLQKNLDTINEDYKKYGGENAAVESGYEDQLSEMKRSIGNGDLTKSEDLTYRLTQKEIDDAKKGRPSAHYLQVMALKQQRDMDIRKLEKAVGMNSGVTAEVKGFGTLTGGFNTGTSSVPDGVNKIFRLLASGIPVYNMGDKLPKHLVDLQKQIGQLDAKAAAIKAKNEENDAKFFASQEEARAQLYLDQIRFKRTQRAMQMNAMSYILPSGNATWQSNNVINRGANVAMDAMNGVYSKLMGGGESGEGIMGALSYKELDRQNTINAIQSLSKLKGKLTSQANDLTDSRNGKLKRAAGKGEDLIAKLVDKTLEANISKLNAINKGEDPSKFEKSIHEFGKKLSDAYDNFSKEYIMEVSAKGGTEAAKTTTFKDLANDAKATVSLGVETAISEGKNLVSNVKNSSIGKLTGEQKAAFELFVEEATNPNRTRPIKEIAKECIELTDGNELIKAKVESVMASPIVQSIETNVKVAKDVVKSKTESTKEAAKTNAKKAKEAAKIKAKAAKDKTEEVMDKTESAILDEMINLVGDDGTGKPKNPVLKVEETFDAELKKHPALKKKWKDYTKTVKKAKKTAIKDGLNIYHQGANVVDAFKQRDIKGVFKGIKKTGSSIGSMFRHAFGNFKEGVIDTLPARGLSHIDITHGYNAKAGKIGAALGGTLGLLGGPLGIAAGAGIGALTGRVIGKKLDKKFPILRGALLERGYMDAPTMKPKDLYAMIMAMKGKLGIQLRAHPEFKELEAVAYKRTIGQFIGDQAKKVGRAIQKTARAGSMLVHGTFPYRNLVGLLDQTINGNKSKWDYKEDVYSYDKFMLYAAIKSLKQGTKDEQNIKNSLMGTKEFRKLERQVSSGKSWILTEIEDKIDSAKKKINRIRHWKYRYFIDFLKANGHPEVENEKDPALIYSMLDAWGKSKKNQKVYNVIKQSKAFINLEKAVLAKGKETKGINLKSLRKHTSGSAGKNRHKYATLIGMLKAANIPIDESDVGSIFNGMTAYLDKLDARNPDVANGIRRSKQYKKLCADMGVGTGATRNKPLHLGIIGRAKNFLGHVFGKKKQPQQFSEIDDRVNVEKYAKELKSNWWKKFLGKKDAEDIGVISKRNADFIFDADEKKTKEKGTKIEKLGAIAGGVFKFNKSKAKVTKRKSEHDAQKIYKDTLKKTKNPVLASLASMNAVLVGISHRTDEITEGVEKGNKGNGGGVGGFFKNLVSTLGKGGIAAGLASLAGIAMLGGGAISRIKNVFGKNGKLKDQSVAAKAGYLTGVDSDNVDESKWGNLERGFNGTKIATATALGGMGKMFGNVKNLKVGVKKAFAKTMKGTVTAAKEGPAEVIEKGIMKVIKDPKIIKKIGPEIAKKITSLPRTIAARFKNFAAQGVKSAKKSFGQAFKAVPAVGWAFAIAEAIAAFAGGMNNAPRYFNISPSDCTAGMRTTSAVASMIKSIIQSVLSITGVGVAIAIGIDVIIPMDWLVQTCYKLVANKADETELKYKQEEEKERAKALGVDAEKLSAAENHSLMSKAGSGIKAAFSKKTYAQIEKEKTAKKLGMTVAEYDKANESYTAGVEGSFKEKYPEFSKLTSPTDAAKAFANREKVKLLEAEAEQMFRNNDSQSIYKVFKAINDKKLGRQDVKMENLNQGFKAKLMKMLKDPEIEPLNLQINEAKRNPFTQFAYFSKGRASDQLADEVLSLAGFGGLKFWGGDNSINTKTLGSRHLAGNAVDFRLGKYSEDQIAKIGEVANKYGIEWGGKWEGFKDIPHFEDKSAPQLLATGGIVRNTRARSITPINHLLDTGDKVHTRLNPGEMVLTKTQQTALFNKLKKYEYQDTVKGASARNPVTLNESPLVSNDKDTLVILNQAIEIQNKIYEEQTRHNKVSEEFFGAMMQFMTAFLSGKARGGYTENKPAMTSSLENGSYDIASGY